MRKNPLKKLDSQYRGRTPEEIKSIIESKTFEELTLTDIRLYEALAPQRNLGDDRHSGRYQDER